MPTDNTIIRRFCMVDDTWSPVNRYLQAILYPSDVVIINLLLKQKRISYRTFLYNHGIYDQMASGIRPSLSL